jgi:nitrogen regulatory protein PII
MKKIEAVVRIESFDGVHQALRDAKVGPFSVSEIKVFDPAAPPGGCYRGAKYPIGREYVKLDWIVRDPDVEATLGAIRDGLDAVGEGHAEVVVQAVEDSMRLTASVWTRARGTR